MSLLRMWAHAFLECNHVVPIVQWAESFVRPLLGTDAKVSGDFWLWGLPSPGLTTSVISRAWYVFTVCKFFIWNRRCRFIFENRFIPGDDVIKLIRNEIYVRVRADFKRLPSEEFERLWLVGNSFIKIDSNNKIVLIR